MAWRIPPVATGAQGRVPAGPEGSRVPKAQERLLKATRDVLVAVAEDVRSGLSETVGVVGELSEAERASVIVELPDGTDAEVIACAIDMENVEAWCDERGRLHVAIGPWYSTKDVDQVVLSTTKVLHVLLGLHATDRRQPASLTQRILASVVEIMTLQKRLADKKDTSSD